MGDIPPEEHCLVSIQLWATRTLFNMEAWAVIKGQHHTRYTDPTASMVSDFECVIE